MSNDDQDKVKRALKTQERENLEIINSNADLRDREQHERERADVIERYPALFDEGVALDDLEDPPPPESEEGWPGEEDVGDPQICDDAEEQEGRPDDDYDDTEEPVRPDLASKFKNAARWTERAPEPIAHTVDGLIPEGAVTLMIADGGAGKSVTGQTIMTCVSSFQQFLGLATAYGSAVGLFCEDPDNALQHRQQRIDKALGVELADFAARHYPISMAGCDAVLWRDHDRTALFHELETLLSLVPKLKVLLIDNGAQVYLGNESDRPEVTQFINALTGLAIRRKIGIVLTAHTSKTSDDSVARAGSGSTAWLWAARSVLKLERVKGTEDATLKQIKVNHGTPDTEFALTWRNGVLVPKDQLAPQDLAIRKDELDRLIIGKVTEAWEADTPYSASHQATGRYLPRALARGTEFKVGEIKERMTFLMDVGRLATGQRKTRTPRGLRVVTNGARDTH